MFLIDFLDETKPSKSDPLTSIVNAGTYPPDKAFDTKRERLTGHD